MTFSALSPTAGRMSIVEKILLNSVNTMVFQGIISDINILAVFTTSNGILASVTYSWVLNSKCLLTRKKKCST